MFSFVRWLPSSLTDTSSSVFLLLIKPGDQIKQTITLTEMTDFSGLNIVGNFWDLVSAQLKMGVSVKHSNCVIYSQLWHWDHTVTWSSMTPRVPGTRLISTLPHTHTRVYAQFWEVQVKNVLVWRFRTVELLDQDHKNDGSSFKSRSITSYFCFIASVLIHWKTSTVMIEEMIKVWLFLNWNDQN